MDPEAMVPQDHPLRVIRPLVNAALERLSPDFDQIYAPIGRPSIPPEQLLRALLLQAFFTIRSERALMEQLIYNIPFRWFVGLSIEAPVWDVTVFTKHALGLDPRESPPVAGRRHCLWFPSGDPG